MKFDLFYPIAGIASLYSLLANPLTLLESRDGANPFTPQAGSGIMLAAIGMHIPDGGIINVAFLMLKSKVTKIELGDLEYKDTNIDEMNERRE